MPAKKRKAPCVSENERPRKRAAVARTSVSTVPSLRRASTLKLQDEEKPTSSQSSIARASSSHSSEPSLVRKSSSIVDADGLVTKMCGLKSGSIIGETTSLAESTTTKEPSLSKKGSKKSLKAASKKEVHVSAALNHGEMASAVLSLRRELTSSGEAVVNNSDIVIEMGEPRMTGNAGMTEIAGTSGETSGMLPPGGLVEVAISFDTTGSMYGCLKEVRAKIQHLIQRLQADIPGIRVCIMAHGDYWDARKYIVKWIDFGASLPEICMFVSEVEGTFGGDQPECYELVLKRAREALSWTPGSQRALIMIGDDVPHPVGYTHGGNTYNIDWRNECALLREMNVKIYGVQAGSNASSEKFFKEMSALTQGKYLPLANFTSMFDFLMMICYREGNPEMMAVYEQEVQNRDAGIMTADLAALVKAMGEPAATAVTDIAITPAKEVKSSNVVKSPKIKKTSQAATVVKSPKIKKKPQAATVVKSPKIKMTPQAATVVKSPKVKKAPEATTVLKSPKSTKKPQATKVVKSPKGKKTPQSAKAKLTKTANVGQIVKSPKATRAAKSAHVDSTARATKVKTVTSVKANTATAKAESKHAMSDARVTKKTAKVRTAAKKQKAAAKTVNKSKATKKTAKAKSPKPKATKTTKTKEAAKQKNSPKKAVAKREKVSMKKLSGPGKRSPRKR